MPHTLEDLPEGPWRADHQAHPEPRYTFEHSGITCSVVRHRHFWNWLGYVQLPPNHPDFSAESFDVAPDSQVTSPVKVHGGFTHIGNGKFGFDTLHYGDSGPFTDPVEGGHYWTFDEVMTETKKVAEQFAARNVRSKN